MAKKILIVDDEPDMLLVVSHGLKKRGYEVFRAKNGREALDLAEQIIPDLIILDVYLPFINGDEVTRTLKHDARFKHIPVILISAVVEGMCEKAKEDSASAYLRKPFELEELVRLVNEYCPQCGRNSLCCAQDNS